MHGTIDKEFFDEMLIGKSLNKPEAQSNICVHSFLNQFEIISQNESIFRPQSYSKEESNYEFECIILSTGLLILQIERALSIFDEFVVFFYFDVLEYFE